MRTHDPEASVFVALGAGWTESVRLKLDVKAIRCALRDPDWLLKTSETRAVPEADISGGLQPLRPSL